MTVYVQDIGAVLVRARCNQQVGNRDPVLSQGRELSLSRFGGGKGVNVHP